MTTDPRVALTQFIEVDEATLDQFRGDLRPDQAMSEAALEEICRRAWEALPGSTPWADLPEKLARREYREEVCGVLTAAADLMPIETLHGADGASVWLRGEQ